MIGKKTYGIGPMPNRILLCGDRPSASDSMSGSLFSGAVGVDLHYVFLRRAAHITTPVYKTNLCKWLTLEGADPTADEIARDEPELQIEIALCNPQIIVALGKVAAQWFMSSNDKFTQWVVDVQTGKPQDIDMEKYYGVPMVCSRYPDKTLLISYHPAIALMQASRFYQQAYWSFEQLGRFVRGEIGVHPPQGAVHYSNAGPNSALFHSRPDRIALDTEGVIPRPWGLSVSARAGTASVLIGTGDTPTKAMLRDVVSTATTVAHNLLHDLNVLEALDVPIDPDRSEDTMLQAYLLPWLPRRLKALAFKLLGVEQSEYVDIIKEPEERISKEFLQKVLDSTCSQCTGGGTELVAYKRNASKFKTIKCTKCAGDGTSWPSPQPQLVFNADFSAKLYKPSSVGRRVRTLLESGTGLREGWTNVDEKVRTHVESVIGSMPEATLDDVPLETAVHYSAADADITLRVNQILEPMLKKNGLWKVYEIDKGIIPIIHRMHNNGILIDRTHFSRIGTQFRSEQSTLVDRLATLAGGPINPSSPLQVASLIYDQLGAKVVRNKRSTDEKTLETLKIKYKTDKRLCESVEIITDYRELTKLIGTYIEPLPNWADANSRVHTRFLLHVVATGRLSSRDPNLQNIPTRTDRGRLIRAGFIPKSGCRLVSVDLDQIELRVAAHMSGDEGMINVFNNGIDIHRATAGMIYGKKIEDITTQERLLAKTINFLILYGGGANRLNNELALLGIKTEVDQCVNYINDWFRGYAGVKEYLDLCRAQAIGHGYVEDLFGRRRYVQGVWSCIDKVRDESAKWATNHPIQGTAASLMKIWMRRVWDNVLPNYWKQGIYCEPLLTVHDELIFEAEDGICDDLINSVVHEAALTANLAVPIKAKGSSGVNWNELK